MMTTTTTTTTIAAALLLLLLFILLLLLQLVVYYYYYYYYCYIVCMCSGGEPWCPGCVHWTSSHDGAKTSPSRQRRGWTHTRSAQQVSTGAHETIVRRLSLFITTTTTTNTSLLGVCTGVKSTSFHLSSWDDWDLAVYYLAILHCMDAFQ